MIIKLTKWLYSVSSYFRVLAGIFLEKETPRISLVAPRCNVYKNLAPAPLQPFPSSPKLQVPRVPALLLIHQVQLELSVFVSWNLLLFLIQHLISGQSHFLPSPES